MNGRVKTIGLTAISLLFLLGCYSVTDKTETPITSTEENSSSTPTVHITAAPTIEIPTTVPSPGFIAFSTFPEREVFMIDSGGGEPVHLTTLPSNAFFPALSPDATQIVYVDAQRDSTTDRIMLMDVDGDGLRQITDAFMVFGGSLAWSSDGESIAFTGNRENVLDFPNIYVANIQDQTITQVSDDSLAEYDLAWSPNGELFAFRAQVQSGEAFTHCLFRMGRNGSNLIQITDPSIGDAAHPAWSPDGQHLAFDVGTFEDSGDIYLIAQDGSELTRLTTHPGNDQYPTWSPDGSQIAFISDREGYNSIYIMNVGEDGLLRVTNKDQPIGIPVWLGTE